MTPRTAALVEGRALLPFNVRGLPIKPAVAELAKQRYLHTEADGRPAIVQQAAHPFTKSVSRRVSYSGRPAVPHLGSLEILTQQLAARSVSGLAQTKPAPALVSVTDRMENVLRSRSITSSPISQSTGPGSYLVPTHTLTVARLSQGAVAPGVANIDYADSPLTPTLYGLALAPSEASIREVEQVLVPALGPAMNPPVQTSIPGVQSILTARSRVFSLTVQVLGTGYGDVISTPDGIFCLGDCYEEYATTTPVTLVATPAPGYSFVGWGARARAAGPARATL
ncbi:MAG: hypothetical protein FJ319_01930 [SAR202 cluster bacterium]|nr:hypothetical protein [SAR202 cluster bacterium]